MIPYVQYNLSQIKNPNIITLFTKFGGHSGFYTTQKRYGDLDGLWAK